MKKAGRWMVLSLVLLALSGPFQDTYAQIQSDIGLTVSSQKDSRCESPLSNILVTSLIECEEKALQKKVPFKREVFAGQEIVHSVEPTKYTPSPTPIVIKYDSKLDVGIVEREDLDADLIFDLINQYRSSIGKSPFLKGDDTLLSLATARSHELYNELYVTGGLHSGLYNRDLPYFVVENAVVGSSEAQAMQWWLNSPIHRRSIQGDYIYAAVACDETRCVQLFTSLYPKITKGETIETQI